MDDISPEAIGDLHPADLFSLHERVAIVTGAAGGIGQWLSAGLGAAGARLLITDVNESGLKRTANILRSADVVVQDVIADLSDENAPELIVEKAKSAFQSVDVLVNNAGMNKRLPILDTEAETYDTIMRVDLRSPYFLAQGAAREMIQQGGGSIINISSINAFHGLERVSVYGQAKAGLSQLTRVQALEWARFGIRANAIAPGFMDTPLGPPMIDGVDIPRWVRNNVAMRRDGRPDELVGLMLLLASDAGSFLTGQTFVADGGLLAGSNWLSPPT